MTCKTFTSARYLYRQERSAARKQKVNKSRLTTTAASGGTDAESGANGNTLSKTKTANLDTTMDKPVDLDEVSPE
jgi:hypothetical protein